MKSPACRYRWLFAIVNLFFPVRKVEDLADLGEACVLLCRHRNMRGPFMTIIKWYDQMSPWVLYPFCEKKDFFEHMYGKTLTARLHWWKPLARFSAWVLSNIIPPFLKAIGTIPVYRGTSRIRETFSRSIETLKSGRHIVIYPDIDYTKNDNDEIRIYDGFFQLDRLFFKEQKKHLKFVPVLLTNNGKEAYFGEAVTLGDGSYPEEKQKAIETLIAQWEKE